MSASLLITCLCSLVALAAAGASSQLEHPDPVVTDRAIVTTSLGTFSIDLFGKDAPRTVENFVGLARQGYFNSLIFHRVARDFVIQTGDSTATGAGGRSFWGKPFGDELNQQTPSYRRGYLRGTVAMANAGPNTNTSQWFVALRDITALPKAYTIFGRVHEGMDVVDKIGSVELAPGASTDGRPKVDVVITSVTIVEPGSKDGRGW